MASTDPGSRRLTEALRGIGFVVLITASVIGIGTLIAVLALSLVEVMR